MDNAPNSESNTYSRISITLPEQMLKAVDSLCRETKANRSAWIQKAISMRLGHEINERFDRLAEVVLRIERRHSKRQKDDLRDNSCT